MYEKFFTERHFQHLPKSVSIHIKDLKNLKKKVIKLYRKILKNFKIY